MDVNWDHYRTFLAVVRAGSLSAAAREIGLTQPTVGRHVDALESHFGTLFIRSPSGFSPTQLAKRLKAYAEALEHDVAAFGREAVLDESTLAGTVRISASEAVGCEVLPPMLVRLRERYPNIAIELIASDRTENLLTREADIAVRMFEPKQNALIAKKIGDIEVGLFALKSYLDRRGRPKRVEELSQHAVIGFDTETAYIRKIRKIIGDFPRSQFALRSDSHLAHIAAIRAGFGIGFCQVGIARQNAELERVLSKTMGFKMRTWIVMHENLKANPVCLAIFNGLRDDLLAYLEDLK